MAPVWAGHPVGFSIDTAAGRQYVAFYDAERRSFLSLVSGDATRERINSMLDAGAPVRN